MRAVLGSAAPRALTRRTRAWRRWQRAGLGSACVRRSAGAAGMKRLATLDEGRINLLLLLLLLMMMRLLLLLQINLFLLLLMLMLL